MFERWDQHDSKVEVLEMLPVSGSAGTYLTILQISSYPVPKPTRETFSAVIPMVTRRATTIE
jgi:hypothetical protein